MNPRASSPPSTERCTGLPVAGFLLRRNRTTGLLHCGTLSPALTHGHRSPKGMGMAALRTRQTKRNESRDALFGTWRAEALALGFVQDWCWSAAANSRDRPFNPHSRSVASARRDSTRVRTATRRRDQSCNRQIHQRGTRHGSTVEHAGCCGGSETTRARGGT